MLNVSHTTDHLGGHFDTPTFTLWINLFAHSLKSRLLWKSRIGHSMPTYSATGWWSKWEIIKYIVLFYRDIEPFCWKMKMLVPSFLWPKLLPILRQSLSYRSRLWLWWTGMSLLLKLVTVFEGDGTLLTGLETAYMRWAIGRRDRTAIIDRSQCRVEEMSFREAVSNREAQATLVQTQ